MKVPVCFESAEYHDETALNKAKKKYSSKLERKFGKADFFIYKKSVDARKTDEIYFIYSVAAKPEKEVISDVTDEDVSVVNTQYPEFDKMSVKHGERPVVVGFGPSGMFCSYVLALAGAKPLIIERGDRIEERTGKVKEYWENGKLDTESNVQFGEGGAGAFSDGKLLSRINDKLTGYVLDKFVEFGAPKEILYLSKPHVGTDLLKNIVRNIRNEIIKFGGSFMFNSKLTGINTDSAGSVRSVEINGSETFEASAVFLCIGHSARDTFSMLIERGYTVTPKSFSVGVRIEHLQSDINRALYGKYAECIALEKAQYTLSHRENGRAVYSFCMCPGGMVVASASDTSEIVTNGMSYYKRDGANANSAIAVSVNESDYGATPMGAIEYQRKIERAAYELAGSNGAAPVQTLCDYMNSTLTNEPKRIIPSYTGKTKICDINALFPEYINEMLKIGFCDFEKKIKGFSCGDAVLTAPETRTSSPVRINRDENFASLKSKNLYPCGEGAGYAGGITSAAVDGIKCAISYLERISE
ncbi:MAG: hypothetical protein J5844_04175 [Clostridia bacterium]|nr:hypothetical protein [Clostridia bacterium]